MHQRVSADRENNACDGARKDRNNTLQNSSKYFCSRFAFPAREEAA
jgi:hypothetical protein